MYSHLYDLLRTQARRAPEAPALLAPGRPTLTYAGLLAQAEATLARLNALGLGRGDRVALVLPNGPELAGAFICAGVGVTCAPLNPAYTYDEFNFYLPDLKVRALIVEPGSQSAAVAVARARGLPVLELAAEPAAPAGVFTLRGQPLGTAARPGPAAGEDVLLLLHTSGTTARPKRVPRTHASLMAAALHYQPVSALTSADCCMNILPMYHVQGLLAALLAPLSVGASAVCANGFSAVHFFDWLHEFQPSWYTAGPALHQTIMELARARGVRFPTPGLRLVRSGAAPMPGPLLEELEQFLGVPVLEAYGLSEAVPLASNPLPPRARKPGSVGLPCGPEVAIAAVEGGRLRPLPPGEAGEIVVRGPTVMQAYDDDPAANAAAFVEGWFRTGDQGYFDADGYLFITGRLKEMINRGGEKITPGEVEAVLAAHPDVAEAAVFAMPDPLLGETVAAAVVLRPGAAFDRSALRRQAAARLAAFKVPERIVAVDAVPRGPTGKVQRLKLAEQLRAALAVAPAAPAYVPPADAFEQRLAQVWGSLLGGARVGRHDNFFELGGHSLLASGLLTQLEAELGRPLPASLLVEAPTLAQLAARLRRAPAARPACLVPLQPRGERPPFFCVHDIGGDVLRFGELAALLGDDQPFYALEAVGLHDAQPPHTSVEAMAAHYLSAVRQAQAAGPYYLGGYCFGGTVAYEMACQLAEAGEPVALVAIFEGYAPIRSRSGPRPLTRERLRLFLANLPPTVAEYRARGLAHTVRRARHVAAQLSRQAARRLRVGQPLRVDEIVAGAEALAPSEQAVIQAHLEASRAYCPGPYAGAVTLLNVRRQSLLLDPDPRRGWQRLARGGVTVRVIDGSHDTILRPPHVASLAAALRASLEQTARAEAPALVLT